MNAEETFNRQRFLYYAITCATVAIAALCLLLLINL